MKMITLISCLFFSSHMICQTRKDTLEVLKTLFRKLENDNYSKGITQVNSLYYVNNNTYLFTKDLFNEVNQVGLIKNGIDTNNIKIKFLSAKKIQLNHYFTKTKNIVFYDSVLSKILDTNHIAKYNKRDFLNVRLSTPIFINHICLIILTTDSYVHSYLFKRVNKKWESITKVHPIYDTVY